MEGYRKALKNRAVILIGCTALSIAAVLLFGMIAGWGSADDGTFIDGFTKGFPCGLFTGFCIIMIFYIVRCLRALSNEALMKKMYILENDERKKMVRQSAMEKCFFFMAGALTVGLTLASFYSAAVTVTLAGVLAFQGLAGVMFKFYYLRKY